MSPVWPRRGREGWGTAVSVCGVAGVPCRGRARGRRGAVSWCWRGWAPGPFLGALSAWGLRGGGSSGQRGGAGAVAKTGGVGRRRGWERGLAGRRARFGVRSWWVKGRESGGRWVRGGRWRLRAGPGRAGQRRARRASLGGRGGEGARRRLRASDERGGGGGGWPSAGSRSPARPSAWRSQGCDEFRGRSGIQGAWGWGQRQAGPPRQPGSPTTAPGGRRVGFYQIN